MTEIALTTSVESFTTDSVYRIRSFLRNSQACIFLIENNTLQWSPVGTSDGLQTGMSGQMMSLLDDNDILNMYRSKRLLVLCQFDVQQTIVIDNELCISYLKGAMNKRPYAVRSFDISDCTFRNKAQQLFNGKSMIRSFNKNDKKDQMINRLPPQENRSLLPRAEHSTKVALTPHQNQLVLRAFPNDRNNSNNGLRRQFDDIGNGWQGHDNLSIPVTDGSGPASHEIATNGQSRYKSIIINNVVDSDGGASRSSQSYSSYLPSTSSHSNGQVPVSRQGFAPSTGNYTTTNPPRHPDYANFNHRKLSFGSWPLSGKPDPTTLANNGFFATGAQDLVRCYHCGIGLKDWISDDDVMTEHIKHSGDCPFLLKELGQERLQRLKTAILYPETTNQDTTSPTPPPQVTLPYKIRHPRYQTMEARITSYEKFPTHVSQTPQQCAVAGFFFTGEKDICRCFTCDGGLQRWDPEDDPIIEHAKYFPTCDYIKQLKGDNYIQQVQMTFKSSQQGATGGPSDQMNGMKSTTTDDLSYTMNGMSVQATSTKDNLDLLRTEVAEPALQMGYSKKDVSSAIEKMRKKVGDKEYIQRQTQFTADELVNFLLDNMDTVQSCDNPYEVNRNDNKHNTDTAYLAVENERLKSLTTCMLCLTGETNILFLPCTHHKTCHDCSKTLTHCPVCGKYIQEKIRTYMA